MTSVRLDPSIESKLERLAEKEHISKTEIIKRALADYLAAYQEKELPYTLGEDLFGKYGSAESDRSRNYKDRLKRKLHEKHSH